MKISRRAVARPRRNAARCRRPGDDMRSSKAMMKTPSSSEARRTIPDFILLRVNIGAEHDFEEGNDAHDDHQTLPAARKSRYRARGRPTMIQRALAGRRPSHGMAARRAGFHAAIAEGGGFLGAMMIIIADSSAMSPSCRRPRAYKCDWLPHRIRIVAHSPAARRAPTRIIIR